MIVHNPNSLCREAEPYYYDFLCKESGGLIPESLINHIEQCQHCRERINQLKAVLSQADSLESEQGQVSSTVTAMLKLHFAYIGKPVTCNIVKPFLPTLLDQALRMSIPTPIVTHVCDCQQCTEDLDIIRCLNLSRKQLWRLGQLMADRSAEDTVRCSTAQLAMGAVMAMDWSGTTAEVLKHLCKCPICRDLLYEERQNFCTSLPEYGQSPEFPCESVSATDIFDYCFPYGIDPAEDEYVKFRPALKSHLRSCPACLAKMQQLHKNIYGIAERAESEVVTIYHIDESAKAEAISESDDLYAGFPIRVERANRRDEVNAGRSASTIDFGAALKQKLSAMNLKPLVRTAVAAAAIILIAVALFFNIPAAKAVTIDQIYKALEKVKNVYISKFVPDKTEPIQEKWVSRALDIYISKAGKRLVCWDITNRVRKTKNLDTTIIERISLTDNMIADLEQRMGGSLGLMPFYDISKVPEDAQWVFISKEGLGSVAEETKVYDLKWIEKSYNGSIVFKKRRFFVDVRTNLPQRIEVYIQLTTDDVYTLGSIIVVKYLTDSEIQTVIREVGF